MDGTGFSCAEGYRGAHSAGRWRSRCAHHSSALRHIAACVLLRIILTELDREIAGWCVCADGLGRSPASDGNRTASSLYLKREEIFRHGFGRSPVNLTGFGALVLE
jgi:hypothetical protein